MKLLVVLGFCLLGLAVAEYAWVPGKEYAFKYEGSVLTGIPHLAPQYAGLVINCKVLVQAKDERTLLIKPTDIAFGNVNSVVGWWISELPVTAVPRKYKTILETPIMVTFNHSMVETVLVSEYEEEWSVNFKKGIMSMLQVNVGEMGSMKPHQLNIVPKEIKGDEIFFHKKIETGVMGDCETMYEVARIPEYMVKEQPHMTPVPELCKEGSVYEITKTVNFDKCIRRPVFHFFSLSGTNCMPGFFGCAGHESLTQVNTYTVCAARSNFIIQRVYSEGTVVMNLQGYEVEKALAMSNITMTLEKMGRISTPITKPSNPITINSLMYDFSLRQHSNPHPHVLSDHPTVYDDRYIQVDYPKSDLPMSDLRSAPHHPITRSNMAHDVMNVVQPEMVKDDARRLLKGIAEDFDHLDDFVNKHVPDNILKVRDALQWLSLEDLRNMFTEFADPEISQRNIKEQTIRSIFLDALSMTGSNPSVMVIKEMILKHKIKGERASQMISEFPKYIETPTKELISELYDLMTSDVVTADRQMRVTSVLAFTTLLNHACIDPSESRSRYFTNFCSSETKEITNKFIPFLEYALRHAEDNHMRVVYLLALGHLAHEAIIPVVKPFIESRMIDSPYVRKAALHSLQKLGRRRPHVVMPILATILDNPAEHYEMRMEAFTMMVLCNAPIYYWEKAALRTWFEPSTQVSSWIYTTISSLSEAKEPSVKAIADKAQIVMPLVKPAIPGIPFSQMYFVSDFMERLKLGYVQRIAWHSSRDSIFPTMLQYHLDYHLGSFIMNPLEVVTNIYGIDNLLNKVLDIFETGHESQLNPRFRTENVKLEKISRLLNILRRPDIPVETSIYIKFCHDIERFLSFDKKSVSHLEREMMKILPHIREGLPFNVQKAVSLGRNLLSIPTPVGVSVGVMIESYGLVSLRGDVRLETTPEIRETNGKINIPKMANVDVNVNPVFDWKVHAKMGVILPFTGKYHAAGIDKHIYMSVPGKIAVQIDVENMKLKVTAKPKEDIGKMDLVHYHIKPFTSITNFLAFLPSTRGVEVRTIVPVTEPEPYQYEADLGEKFTGLKLKYEHKTRGRHLDISSLMEALHTKSILHNVMFLWVSPTNHETEVRLIFDRTNSKTKEIEMQISIGTARKTDNIPSFTDRPETTAHTDVLNLKKDSLYSMLSKSEVENAVSVDAIVKFTGVHNHQYVATVTYGSEHSSTKPKVSIFVDSKPVTDMNIPSFALCMEGDLKFPRLPHLDLDTVRSEDITSYMNWKILFGENCKSGSKITIAAEMRRTADVMDYVSKIPEFKLCQKEQENGIRTGPHCARLMVLNTMLNEIDMKIHYNEMPGYVAVVTHKVENFLKAYLYPYMHDTIGAQNPDHEIHVISHIHPKMETMDLSIRKPKSDIMFHHIKMLPVSKCLLPVSAKHDMVTMTWDTLIGAHQSYACTLDKGHITTFDNVTYMFRMNDCDHVIIKDCSETAQVAVLAKQVSGKNIVRMLLQNTEIEVTPPESNSDMWTVTANGEKVDIPEKKSFQIKDHRDKIIAEIFMTKDGMITIKDIVNNIELLCGIDRVHIHVFSHAFRNKLCGLCGDFNGEKVADLKSPEMCILKNPELFGYTYMLPDDTCSDISIDKKTAMEKEIEDCTRHEVIKSKLDGLIKEQTTVCTIFRHLVFDREGEICFSKVPLPKCSSPCRSTTMKNKVIEFHCMKVGSVSEKLEMKAKHSVVEELRDLPVNFVTTFGIPESCRYP